MKLSALAVLLAVVSLGTATDPDLDKCAWGESYWCSDLRVAKSCGAIEHCKATVWKNQQLPEDTSDVCVFCKTIVADVHKFISDKKTEAEIAQFLSSACNIIPNEKMASECKKLVTEYAPEIIDLIVAELDPQVVCGLLKLCTGLEDHMKHYAVPSSSQLHRVSLIKENAAGASQICNDCKKFFGDIRDMLTSNETEAQIEKFIDDQICTMLGSFQQECVEMVKQYVPLLMKYLASLYCIALINRYAPNAFELLATLLDPDSRCTNLGFCPGESNAVPSSDHNVVRGATPKVRPTATHVTASAECVICEFVMKELTGLLTKNATEAEIIAALDKVCSLLPKTIEDSCIDFVNTYGRVIIALIQQELDPTQICTFLGLCSKSTAKLSAPQVNDDETCIICETLVQYIEALIDENSTVADIERMLKKVCSFLPLQFKTECDKIVMEYGPSIIHYIIAKYDPHQVCTAIKLCDKSKASNTLRWTNLEPAKALLGQKECTYGPAYWCANRQNAEKCGAVDHCKEFVWKN